MGRLEEAQEVFDQVAASEPACHTFNPEDFWRIKGAHDLTRREQAILRELYIWRDQEAQRYNRPPFKVLNNRTLITVAQTCPCTLDELSDVQGLKAHHVRRYGERILKTLNRGIKARLPRPPTPPPRHTEAEIARFQALRGWRRQVADDRGVETDVIISNAILWSLAEQNPATEKDLEHIEGLGPWKRQAYGKAILDILAR
jgi:ribonuclease D